MLLALGASVVLVSMSLIRPAAQSSKNVSLNNGWDTVIENNADHQLTQGRNIFRFDTFGDEAFFGRTLRLHEVIAGARFGGVGAGLSPASAINLGLKVDVDALPADLVTKLRRGQVDLNDPAVTLALLKLNAVVGMTGFFGANGGLSSVGIQCAFCHATVNNSLTFGIGKRLDGWANRDLNVGAILALAPNVKPITDLLRIADPGVTDAAVRSVFNSWGPGKFDAILLLDGKSTNPVTGGSAATMLPNAYGLSGFNLHTWTGGWGTVTYWNAFVANIEMKGKGTFFDTRLDNAAQYPIAAAAGFGHLKTDANHDRITKKLPALSFYQLAIPAPKPRPGIDFNLAAAIRGDALFGGKAGCNNCHVEPLWTEPGWNAHKPADIKIESFQADRSPDHSYKTMNLAGLFVRENGLYMKPENKGRFYHDGRFKTLLDVVKSYDARFNLGMTPSEMLDLVEYLKALFSGGSALG